MSTDTIMGIILGSLISLILSLIFYFKSKSVRLPTFIYSYVQLQTKTHPEISISFRGERISNLSRSRILFINKGRKEIRAQDNPQSGFPKIVLPDGARILSVSVPAMSSSDIMFRTEKINDSILEISYDYLNHNDGGVVEILFDGAVSTKNPIDFKAPLIGAAPTRVHFYLARVRGLDRYLFIGIDLILGFFTVTVLIGFSQSLAEGIFEWKKLASGSGLALITCLTVWIHFISPYRKRVPAWAVSQFESSKRN